MLATRRAVQAIVVLVLWGLITHGTYAGSGDEPHYHLLSLAMIALAAILTGLLFDALVTSAPRRTPPLEPPLC